MNQSVVWIRPWKKVYGGAPPVGFPTAAIAPARGGDVAEEDLARWPIPTRQGSAGASRHSIRSDRPLLRDGRS